MTRREFLTIIGSAAATWPLAARTQPTRPIVGVISPASAATTQVPEPFLRSMKELGWEEGGNYRVLWRYAEGHFDRVPALTDELVSEQARVIVVLGDPLLEAVHRVNTTIPTVAMVDDPSRHGLAASIARPGGNITGVNLRERELDAKRLELLHEAVPATRRIGILLDPTVPSTRPQLDETARALKLELVVVTAHSRQEVIEGLDTLAAAHVGAVNVLASPSFAPLRRLSIERLNSAGLPSIFEYPESAQEGGLLGYGPRLRTIIRHMAGLVDKILRGARPEDLPIEQPEKIDFTVNLKTAKALGITIPPLLLARADEVVE
jgi:putative tryptophan/tyrosine transport system substrate-binding protein